MDDHVFIETTHINRFKTTEFDLEAEENQHLLEHMNVTPDGKILSVERAKVAKHLKDKEIFLIRMGFKPFPKGFKIEDEEGFWRCVAHLVDIDED